MSAIREHAAGGRRGPSRQEFTSMAVSDREVALRTSASHEGAIGGSDPLLHLSWSAPVIQAAADAGHTDASIPALEATLVAAGGQRIADGLFQFVDGNSLHQAILALYRAHPWLRSDDPSHPGQAVAEPCVEVNWTHRGRIGFAHLAYFWI
ncbi:hypothetical protein HYH03_016457 [Edaphochlamys debaryana]|uniref:Uncharacterized protein n=1 Tax=Edaphochlamys debaryana TaxID=47281 RepID=A0A835XPT7_9CHLO|nr:hypothetical protein HYH03_016457 [Edaphochlamys debaryana]|eukprot:KAG2484805.1 hypothetical protein HYH03_016457 [Edaphochlamys debaryana]